MSFHHYLAQSHLRYFSPDGKGVYRLGKNERKILLLPIKGVAGETNLYSFETVGPQKNSSIENPFLSEIDGGWPMLVKHISAKKPLSGIRDQLVQIMSVSYARVPEQLANFDRMATEMYRERYRLVGPELNKYVKRTIQEFTRRSGRPPSDTEVLEIKKKHFGSLVEPGKKQSLITMLAVIGVFGNVIRQANFSVGFAPEGSSFIISDNPAGNHFLPLTASTCLFYSFLEDNKDYFLMTAEMVDEVNRETYRAARDYVFSREKPVLLDFL